MPESYVQNSAVSQSASHLTYRLIAARPDLRPLRVLATRELQWCSWRVRFHVLGASHAVELRSANANITELFTCVPAEPVHESLIDLDAEGPSVGFAHTFGLVCRVSIDPFSRIEGDLLSAQFTPQCRLEVAFPGLGKTAPVTRIGWRITGPTLVVNTVHSYPEEARVVRSATVFELEDTGK